MKTTTKGIKKLVRSKMVENDIYTVQELSRRSSIDYQRLNVRILHPETFRVSELRALQKVLDLSDHDILEIMRG